MKTDTNFMKKWCKNGNYLKSVKNVYKNGLRTKSSAELD